MATQYQRTLDEIEMPKPARESKIDIAGMKVRQKEGVFWIQKQRQMHSLHYISPYQASFPPQIPAFFVEHYSKPGDIVLDPFCGRGTTILEANLRGRVGIGVDVSPLAIQLAKVKLKNVTYEMVEKRLREIDFSKMRNEGYERFKDIYDPRTYSQILSLRDQLTSRPVDNFIRAVILGRLHGHSANFFSVFTFNVISPSPEAIAKQNVKYNSKPEFRDVIPRILTKARTVLRDPIPEVRSSWCKIADSRKLPIGDKAVDLIVTSPPFLATINYIDDNWLRFWFLGFDEKKMNALRRRLVQTPDIEVYKEFLGRSIDEMERVLKPGKYCVIEVGDVSHNSKKLNLDEVVIDLVRKNGFEIEEVLVNYMSSPKISKAFSRESKKKGTKTNRCVIMRKR